nr:unnamed protein product [Callosobruchus chinensis]
MVKKAYRDAALSKTRVYQWFSSFKNGEMSIEDQPRPGRPSTSRNDENIEKINALVREDRRLTIDQLCEMSGISWSSVQRILSEDLYMRIVHDNAPAHTALSVKQFLTKNGMTPIVHPPYSPDLAPCDFFLFPRLKKDMKGKRFASVEEVKQKSLKGLKNIPKTEFKKCFEQWKDRLEKCVVIKGEYFEGDQNLV